MNYLILFTLAYLARDTIGIFFTRFERVDSAVPAAYAVPTIDLSKYELPSLTPTPIPTRLVLPTPSPTLEPSPTPTKLLFTALFSYYDPALLGVNCHPANIEDGVCGVTASGLDWKNYDKLVAVPLDYPYPLFTRLLVYEPEFLRGEWVVADYCPGCLSYRGEYYLDFLMSSKRWCNEETLPCPIPWGTTVRYEVLP